ncbi:hypothetical protein Taro_010784 [Colocasia esculenta]|uniref:Uncharacterized protein n=1 Tax=Colocasia esculenta TaxID=4460 RepID=A0A843U408_COLES|nr:hypothetical protein [Colocasia esculenta]
MVAFGDFRSGAQIPLREEWVPEHRRYSHPLRFILTPSAKELGITFRTGIGIAFVTTIQNQHSETVDKALRLPRLRESLAEPTRGAVQSQRSEVVFNTTQDLLPRSWIWVPEHRRYSHPLRFILTPSAKELGITFHTGIGIAYVTTIWNRHSETVDKALVSRNSVPGPKFPPERPAISPIPRFFGSSDSLDYANRWRSPHTEPPSHSDRKSCSTRREISSPVHRLPYPPVGRGYLFAQRSEPPARPQFRIGTSTRSVNGRIRRFPVRRPNSSPGARSQAADAIAYGHRFVQTDITFRSIIGITYKTLIRNRHSEAIDAPLLPQAIKHRFGRLPRLRESLAEPTRGAAQSQRSEVVFNSTRDLLPRSWIWVPEHRRYSHPLRFILTPSATELGITFRMGIRIAYVTTIRNRHSETVDKGLVSLNSVPRPKFPPERVY